MADVRLDDLCLGYLGDPAMPRYVGVLQLVSAGKGVSLHYGKEWLANGFALSEDLPLIDAEQDFFVRVARLHRHVAIFLKLVSSLAALQWSTDRRERLPTRV